MQTSELVQDTNQKLVRDLRRKEDLRLLRGKGLFVEDVTMPNTLYASLVRSEYPHARIRRIDKTKALEIPGVFAIYTGQDLHARLKPFAPIPNIAKSVGGFVLALDKVRYVGEPVAIVLAENRYLAEDAKELVNVEYEALDPVPDSNEAMNEGAVLIHEGLGSNIGWDRKFEFGNADAALARSEIVLEDEFRFHRFSSVPLEPFGSVARFDDSEGILTIWTQQQAPGRAVAWLSEMLDIPSNKIRLRTQDAGGGFGIKISTLPYDVLVAILSIETKRPVKWIETRSENLTADVQGNERIWKVKAGFSKEGLLTSLKVHGVDVQGAYLRFPEPIGCLIWNQVVCNSYRVRDISVHIQAVLTNKAPVGANRGYGRMQYLFMIERLIDIAAQKIGLDPAEMRLKNFIDPESFPYPTPSGCIYDSGSYKDVLEKAMKASGYMHWREVSRRERNSSRLIGVGIAGFVESGGSNYAQVRLINSKSKISGCPEYATVSLDSLAAVTVALSSSPSGQGHETSAALVVSNMLGVPLSQIYVVPGFDSFVNPYSGLSGTTSSRFVSAGIGALVGACNILIEKIKRIGAHVMSIDVEKVKLSEGKVTNQSGSKVVPLSEIAFLANSSPLELPRNLEPGLRATYCYSFPEFTLPSGDMINNSSTYAFNVHVAVIEIDKETGKMKFLKYVIVDDCGNVINEKIVEGQLHGSAAHGVGGSIFEKFSYSEDAQPLNCTFMDYLAPSAVELPNFEIFHNETPSPFSVTGAKGMGEGAGTSLACIANAIADALPNSRVVESHYSPEDILLLSKTIK